MKVTRGDVVLVDYPFTAGGAKVRPALVVQTEKGVIRLSVPDPFLNWVYAVARVLPASV